MVAAQRHCTKKCGVMMGVQLGMLTLKVKLNSLKTLPVYVIAMPKVDMGVHNLFLWVPIY